MTGPHEAKQVDTGTEPGESCAPPEDPVKSAAEAGGPAGSAIPEATPIPTPNDSHLLQKIDASVEDQLSLAKLSFGILGRISDQLKQQAEESLVRVQRPIFLELVLLHDNLERAIEWARGSGELSVKDVVSRLEILRIELLEILFRKDVRPFEEHPASLDPKLHRTMKTLPTAELNENNTVAQILRTGFFWGERVLRPEEVVIKKYAIQEPPKGD
jgi:molecular chaperone GrpE (heat shock protein)